MLWLPAPKLLVVTVATPPESVPVRVPPPLPLMTKVTVPVGVPDPDVTLAVRVTVCPKVEGSGEEVTVVVVGALLTSWAVVPLEGLKLESPLYWAVMKSRPTGRALVVTEAVPPDSV